MFSLRNQSGRMAFLLQLCAGTISRKDVEAITVQESAPYKRARPVLVDNLPYPSITDAAGIEWIARRSSHVTYKGIDHHRAINRIHKEIVRKIAAGEPGYQYL